MIPERFRDSRGPNQLWRGASKCQTSAHLHDGVRRPGYCVLQPCFCGAAAGDGAGLALERGGCTRMTPRARSVGSMPVTEHLPAGHRELLASKDFHRLLARRWRMSLLLTALPVRPLLRLHHPDCRQQAVRIAPHRRRDDGWDSARCRGDRRRLGAHGDLRRLGQPPLRPRSRAAARAPAESLSRCKPRSARPTASAVVFFLVIVALTLAVTYWAARRTRSTKRVLCRRDARSARSRTAWRSPATT